ncbi:MAG TPA: glycosyltransferase [Actinomycetes bacterium]|nr:glycosyltransferase [Actinomycetes bacterium]
MDDRASQPSRFTAVICTRDRPGFAARALAALSAQSRCDFDVLVVDQGGAVQVVEEARTRMERLSVIPDAGQGLSRARNVGWRAAATEWLVFLDDDCVPSPSWADELYQALDRHPDADFIGPRIVALDSSASSPTLPVAVSEKRLPGLQSGRWVRPWAIGLGACMAVRRSAIERLGGWDERLGAGSAPFPASEDMDFNYRLLRAGGVAYVAPDIEVSHDQWRPREALPRHFGGYMAGWAGFSMKHLRTGDVAGGLWLWAWGVIDIGRTLGGAVRRRSALGFRVAAAKTRGLLTGTARGLTYRWKNG